MSANHMNLKRISHRIKEELGSTIEVAKVVGIKGAFATFRGKVDIQIMVHNGHIEYPRIKKHLMQKHEAMNAYFEKMFTEMTVLEHSTFPNRMKIIRIAYGFAGGKDWKMHLRL